MSRSRRVVGPIGLVLGVVGVFAALAVESRSQGAPQELRGVWTAGRSKWRVEGGGQATVLELSLRYSRNGGHSNSSQTVSSGELLGLTTAALTTTGGIALIYAAVPLMRGVDEGKAARENQQEGADAKGAW